MFLKTSRKLGRRFLSSPTYVYDHCFSPKYCNFLKKALPPKLTISNSIFHVTGRVNFLIYQSELYSSPAYKRIKTAQFNNAIQDHWCSGPCFFLYPHHQLHLTLILIIKFVDILLPLFTILFSPWLWHLLTLHTHLIPRPLSDHGLDLFLRCLFPLFNSSHVLLLGISIAPCIFFILVYHNYLPISSLHPTANSEKVVTNVFIGYLYDLAKWLAHNTVNASYLVVDD